MKVIATNKKASFNYFLSDEIECGIELKGSEVKSIREGHISILESFIKIKNGEVFLKNCYIKPYKNAGNFIPEEKRDRRLLMHKNQILRYQKKVEAEGYTIVPIRVGFNEFGKVKLDIALGKGKKLFDKRDVLKERTINRNLQRYKKI